MSNLWPPADLDRDELTAIACRVLERDDIDLRDWAVQAVAYDATNPVSGGVYRIQGSATAANETISWSVILKIVRAPAETESRPGYWTTAFVPATSMSSPPMYWKREALAYRSGLLDSVPAGLLAPRCFVLEEKSPTCYWLWLEDISGSDLDPWTPFRYQEAARHLGQFNGVYLAGCSAPTHPWLASGWMRGWLSHLEREGGMDWITRLLAEDPLLRSALPSSLLEGLRRLWHDREIILLALDSLPQVLCHHDAVPANLLRRTRADGEAATIAVDWAA
jgi:Phosphotransferase enzyme family